MLNHILLLWLTQKISGVNGPQFVRGLLIPEQHLEQEIYSFIGLELTGIPDQKGSKVIEFNQICTV